jgi:hypothetical protein
MDEGRKHSTTAHTLRRTGCGDSNLFALRQNLADVALVTLVVGIELGKARVRAVPLQAY